jgi:hypothetical protein
MSDTYVYITLGGICIVVVSTMLRYCYKSKCSSIDLCCGALHVERNTDIERANTPENNGNDPQNIFSNIRFSRIT